MSLEKSFESTSRHLASHRAFTLCASLIVLLLASQGNARAQGGPAADRIRAELITILPDGLYPKSLTRPQGQFLLAVDNRSGRVTEDLSIALDRVAGKREVDVRLGVKKLKWRGLVNLTPGSYVLTVGKNPAWICNITITAK